MGVFRSDEVGRQRERRVPRCPVIVSMSPPGSGSSVKQRLSQMTNAACGAITGHERSGRMATGGDRTIRLRRANDFLASRLGSNQLRTETSRPLKRVLSYTQAACEAARKRRFSQAAPHRMRPRETVRFAPAAAVLALAGFGSHLSAQLAPDQVEFFEKKIRPVLAEKCTSATARRLNPWPAFESTPRTLCSRVAAAGHRSFLATRTEVC